MRWAPAPPPRHLGEAFLRDLHPCGYRGRPCSEAAGAVNPELGFV